ncbi:TPA: hypothetical protein DCY67_05855 [Candidatus Acetothermia bacterium]|nr:hypothetical protein [Candidatus Acetothermia bacterium]
MTIAAKQTARLSSGTLSAKLGQLQACQQRIQPQSRLQPLSLVPYIVQLLAPLQKPGRKSSTGHASQ